jgi:hypothetical protein
VGQAYKLTDWFIGLDTATGTADINLWVAYKIKALPFLGMFTNVQRFITVTNFNGEIEWDAAPTTFPSN